MTTKKSKDRKVPIVRTNLKDIPVVFVNDLIVNHTPDAFFITFSQIEIPVVASEKESKNIKGVRAIVKHKIVVTPDFLRITIRALEKNFEAFEEYNKGE